MKKVILFLAILLCSTVFAKAYTENEKKEILRQFVSFREAMKNKDIKSIKSVLIFPLYDEYEILFTDGNIYSEKDYLKTGKISEKLFDKYSEKFDYEILKDFEKVKIDSEKNKITNYLLENITAEDKKRKFYLDEERYEYYYKDKNNKKIYKNICNLRTEVGFDKENPEQEVFYASSFSENSELMTESTDCLGGIVFIFKLADGRLKLDEIFAD